LLLHVTPKNEVPENYLSKLEKKKCMKTKPFADFLEPKRMKLTITNKSYLN